VECDEIYHIAENIMWKYFKLYYILENIYWRNLKKRRYQLLLVVVFVMYSYMFTFYGCINILITLTNISSEIIIDIVC